MPSTMPTESRSLSSLERTESSLFQILFHVPSSSQALSLLQAVAYAPYLLGSSLHCAPVRNIQRTPLSVFRSLALGLPPFAKFCLGKRGSRTAHCLSVKAVIDYQLSIKREVLKYLLGLNLIMQVLIWKYVCPIPLNIIVSLLELTYGLKISEGTLVLFLKKASAYFGKPYEEILASIRGAPIKHADETGWRVNGVNNWRWAFVSRDTVYYTIEETRGKGIPEKTLAHCHKEDILVRDDYAGYKNLAFTHQSCWDHLLRESRKEAIAPTVSLEMRKLHKELKNLYEKAAKAITIPFVKQERE